MPRVAVVGNLARDRIDGGAPQPGGCPVFAALALRLLGRDAQILTRCATSDAELLAAPLRGLDVDVLSAERTAGFEHAYENEMRATSVTSIGDPWTPADASRLPPEVRWVHVAPLLRSDFPPETLAAFAGEGRTVSLDAQGLVREPRLGPLEQNARFDPALLEHVSVLKLSEEEARIVAAASFDASTVRALGVPEILVTLGSNGEVVWMDGGPAHISTTPVLDVETTGAGDAFMVAYAVARSDGFSAVEAARRASALVSRMLGERKRERSTE